MFFFHVIQIAKNGTIFSIFVSLMYKKKGFFFNARQCNNQNNFHICIQVTVLGPFKINAKQNPLRIMRTQIVYYTKYMYNLGGILNVPF